MEIKELMKHPKRQLVKIAVERNLTNWEDGLKLSREVLLDLIKNS